MLDWNDLYYFTAVVQYRGFAAASRGMKVSKSSLSRRVSRLEAQLGGRLIDRTTRRFAVTDLGREFLGHCQAMVAEVEAALEVSATRHAEPRGLVRATCPIASASQIMARILPRFLAEFPRVRIQLVATNRAVDLVEEKVDVAIRVRYRTEPSTSLIVRPLGHARLILVAAPGLDGGFGPLATAADLARWPTIAHLEKPIDAVWTLTGPAGEAFTLEHRPRLCSGDFAVLRSAVHSGFGVALLPEFQCLNDLRDGRLVRVLPGWHGGQSVIQVVHAASRGRIPAVRALADFLFENVPPLLEFGPTTTAESAIQGPVANHEPGDDPSPGGNLDDAGEDQPGG